jgi:hypothetical protein
MQVAVCSHGHVFTGHVSTCKRPCIHSSCIHMQVAMFPHGYISTCKWPCIHMVMCPHESGRCIHMVMYPHASGPWSCTTWSCIHMQVAVYPHTSGSVSTWSCIQMQVAVYPHSHVSHASGRVSTWSCIHMHTAVYAHGHVSSWSCIHMQVTRYPHGHVSTYKWPCIHMRNLVVRNGKLAPNLEDIVRQNICKFFTLRYLRPVPSTLKILPSLEKETILRCGPLRRMIFKFRSLDEFKSNSKRL